MKNYYKLINQCPVKKKVSLNLVICSPSDEWHFHCSFMGWGILLLIKLNKQKIAQDSDILKDG